MAEAGGDEDGQRAVIQVVLNRVRHPAFAKTVCGVVFEGSYRATGCQFTFTCDGALARRYDAAAWARARKRASEALDGWVYAPVGLATHYHTDWVHPYWSDSLLKLARVDTHLFFRWRGFWGKASALSALYRGGEPAIAQIAYLASHADAAGQAAARVSAEPAIQGAAVADIVERNGDGGAFVLLSGVPSPASAREMGRGICGDRHSCKVLAWFERSDVPGGYPVPAIARAKLGFSYFRDARNDEIVLYDCTRFAGVTPDACIPSPRTRRTGPATGPAIPVATGLQRAAQGMEALATPISGEPRPAPEKITS